MDQSCFAPIGLSSFYIGLSVLEGKNKDEIYQEWIEKFPNTWAVSFVSLIHFPPPLIFFIMDAKFIFALHIFYRILFFLQIIFFLIMLGSTIDLSNV